MTAAPDADFFSLDEAPLDAYRRVMSVNVDGVFHGLRHLIPLMRDGAGERDRAITVTASRAGLVPTPADVIYAASKAAVAGMTLTMARDLGSLGIRVNTIAPSLFETGLTARVTEDRAENMTKDAAFPRRMGRPDEYGRLAVAIIENPMLNGDTIRLDGGQRFAPK